MKTRIENIPILRTIYTAVDANKFNVIKLATLRFGPLIHIDLIGLRHLEFIIEPELWLCVDRSLNDLPVIAWTSFHHDRHSLATPVKCQLRYYHNHADLLIDKILALVIVNINRQLKENRSNQPATIQYLSTKKGVKIK